MAADPLTKISTRVTPQDQPATPEQVRNRAGGYVFAANELTNLRRFITLGSSGGTFYATETELTAENAQVVLDFVRTDPITVVDEVVEISEAGRAPRQNPALFALAVASSPVNPEVATRQYALAALPRVARTATHLALFVRYAKQFRGWGRMLRRAVAAWYLNQPVEDLVYQVLKYPQREGYTHKDLVQLSQAQVPLSGRFVPTAQELTVGTHWAVRDTATDQLLRDVADQILDFPTKAAAKAHIRSLGAVTEPDRQILFDLLFNDEGFIWPMELAEHDSLRRVEGYARLRSMAETKPAQVAEIIREYRLSWEMIPDRFINHAETWEALLDAGLPLGAMIRQLPRLTRLGLLYPTAPYTGKVTEALTDVERLRKARIHPINMLVALRTYASGQGARSAQSWSPSRPITDALDAGFYAAFGAVEPTGKRLALSLDVSASMTWHNVSGLPLLPREAAAAMSLVTANVESAYETLAFSGGISRLAISPRQRLDDVISTINRVPAGPTDCALPMLWAIENKVNIDTFVVYTDNETWYGGIHPFQALQRYRETSGLDAKLVVVSMTANGSSIANPDDVGMLDVSGFDSAVPNVISDFARGL